MIRYRRLRNIVKLLHVLEVCVAFTLFSWLSTRLPNAVRISGEYIPQLSGYLLNPHLVFLIGNAIIIALVALYRQNYAGKNGGTDLFDDYIQNSERVASIVDIETQPPLTQQTTEHDKHIVCSLNAVAQMHCDAVDTAIKQATKEIRRFQRTQSEKLKRDLRVKPHRELCRSETETHRRIVPARNELRISSFNKVDTLSNEEFRRTIDAFILNHQSLMDWNIQIL
ncbi:hypothetical protein F0562_036022 [Nyssa sinensis]|uniref:DUF4408 domain-containing protein n=1 Tax=Nyssa sinensis TaxID=561372 RepID=A0A5J5AGT3_9ASTE|nr:hypothetical protein F0562_036022 [Nyssa sinensis]